MGVDVYAGTFGLFKQHLKVFQIVAGDEDTGIGTHIDAHFRDFGMTITAGVGSVEDFHTFHTKFSSAEGQCNESFYVKMVYGESGQGVAHEAVDV